MEETLRAVLSVYLVVLILVAGSSIFFSSIVDLILSGHSFFLFRRRLEAERELQEVKKVDYNVQSHRLDVPAGSDQRAPSAE